MNRRKKAVTASLPQSQSQRTLSATLGPDSWVDRSGRSQVLPLRITVDFLSMKTKGPNLSDEKNTQMIRGREGEGRRGCSYRSCRSSALSWPAAFPHLKIISTHVFCSSFTYCLLMSASTSCSKFCGNAAAKASVVLPFPAALQYRRRSQSTCSRTPSPGLERQPREDVFGLVDAVRMASLDPQFRACFAHSLAPSVSQGLAHSLTLSLSNSLSASHALAHTYFFL